jgi:two-component system, OmpR family, phosphate regulon response regulator PhoB
MSSKNILIVEDDANISKLIKYNLEKEGFKSHIIATGDKVFSYLKDNKVDLVLLDLMLPGKDGLEICRELKQDKKLAKIPVVMLTAKGEEVDRIVGLELGADDYVVKPFSPRELVLRIKAVLKRGMPSAKEDDIISVGPITINIPTHSVTVDGNEIELTSMEFKLLAVLMERKGRVQSRDVLLNDVWDISPDVTTRTVDTHVKRLRKKIGEKGELIETLHGVGYRFKDGGKPID